MIWNNREIFENIILHFLLKKLSLSSTLSLPVGFPLANDNVSYGDKSVSRKLTIALSRELCTNFASRYSCTMRVNHYIFRMEWYEQLHWRIQKLSWASKLVTLLFCRKETEKETLQYQNAYHTSSTASFAFIWPASILNILWQFCCRSLELSSLLKLCRFQKAWEPLPFFWLETVMWI